MGRRWVYGSLLGSLIAIAVLGATARQSEIVEAAFDPVVWVNDPTYGSAGKGFYHDFVSGQVWTAERGWHLFSPQPPRAYTPPLWVDYLNYGSAGGGFYLDTVSGLVWTAERDWHSFDPRPAPVAPLVIKSSAFCRSAINCPSGAEPLLAGQPIRAGFSLSRVPTERLTANAYFNGALYQSLSWAFPSTSTGFNTGDTLGIAPGPGTIELRVYVGSTQVGRFSASVTGTVAQPPFNPPTGLGCWEREITPDWEVCVRDSFLSEFEVRVTVLSRYAAQSTFQVRVYCPEWDWGDSFLSFPVSVGQTFTFDFPFDFSIYSDCGSGEYEIQLLVDFLIELRLYVDIP